MYCQTTVGLGEPGGRARYFITTRRGIGSAFISLELGRVSNEPNMHIMSYRELLYLGERFGDKLSLRHIPGFIDEVVRIYYNSPNPISHHSNLGPLYDIIDRGGSPVSLLNPIKMVGDPIQSRPYVSFAGPAPSILVPCLILLVEGETCPLLNQLDNVRVGGVLKTAYRKSPTISRGEFDHQMIYKLRLPGGRYAGHHSELPWSNGVVLVENFKPSTGSLRLAPEVKIKDPAGVVIGVIETCNRPRFSSLD